ncbi:MAG: methionine adenosyltransferase [Abditibacteriota bacterium]|nr:methionine adenosyltransferase [Abditibacteriota bacterium]
MSNFFTSESVTEGHPDKMADQISDAILDDFIKIDPLARVACETMVSTGNVFLAGEISIKDGYVDIPGTARSVIKDIGYDSKEACFDYNTCSVMTSIDEQSPDIAVGVDGKEDEGNQGAGDQGMMFGYATNETPELMPMPIMTAHKLARQLAMVRKNKVLPYRLFPDGKTQVTCEYEGNRVVAVSKIVVSTQHEEDLDQKLLRKDIIEKVIRPIVPEDMFDYSRADADIFVNPTGCFAKGGPLADTGLTGRKIIVDTYGGAARHGGGAFSGKDPTKVDRSAAYMMRYVAKNIVAAGLADKCEVEVGYAIGKAEPMGINVETFGTGKADDETIAGIIRKVFDLTPAGIIKTLDLQRPIYRKTAAYGHFGRNDDDFTWEKTDKAEEIKSLL